MFYCWHQTSKTWYLSPSACPVPHIILGVTEPDDKLIQRCVTWGNLWPCCTKTELDCWNAEVFRLIYTMKLWRTAGNYLIRFVLLKKKKKIRIWDTASLKQTHTQTPKTKQNKTKSKNQTKCDTDRETHTHTEFTTTMASPLSVFTRLWRFMTCDRQDSE